MTASAQAKDRRSENKLLVSSDVLNPPGGHLIHQCSPRSHCNCTFCWFLLGRPPPRGRLFKKFGSSQTGVARWDARRQIESPFCFGSSAASTCAPTTFVYPSLRSRKVCANAGNQVGCRNGTGPGSGRVQCLGFAVRIPISQACHRGFSGIAVRKGHANGFPQATVAPHESPQTHL